MKRVEGAETVHFAPAEKRILKVPTKRGKLNLCG